MVDIIDHLWKLCVLILCRKIDTATLCTFYICYTTVTFTKEHDVDLDIWQSFVFREGFSNVPLSDQFMSSVIRIYGP